MKQVQPGSLLLPALLALAFGASPARATEPQWSGEFAFGTIGNSASATAAVAWDDNHDGTPSIFIGGKFTTVGGVACNAIARWDGMLWNPLGGGIATTSGTLAIRSMIVHNDGTGEGLIAGGVFNTAGGNPAIGVARWRDGQWSALGDGLGDPVFNLGVKCFAIHKGDLYAGGNFQTSGANFVIGVARWSGSAWVVVNNGLGQNVECLASYDEQLGTGPQLFAGGSFSGRVRHLDGNVWTSLNVSGNSQSRVTQLTVFNPTAPAGKPLLFAAGRFTSAGGTTVNNIASWDGTAWSDVGGGIEVLSDFPSITGMTVVNNRDIGQDNDRQSLMVGGVIDKAGDQPSNEIVIWDGSSWSNPIDPGTFPQFLYAPPAGSPTRILAGGIGSNGIAQLGTQAWYPIGNGGATGFSPSINRVVAGFEKSFHDGKLSVGLSGTFYQPGTGLAQDVVVSISTDGGGHFVPVEATPNLSGSGAAITGSIGAPGQITKYLLGQLTSPCSGGTMIQVPPAGPPNCIGPLFGGADPRCAVVLRPPGGPSPLIHVGGNFLDAGGIPGNSFGAYFDPATNTWLTGNPFFPSPNGPEFAAEAGDFDGDGQDDFVVGGSFSQVAGQGADNWFCVTSGHRDGPHIVLGTGTAGFSSAPLAFAIGGSVPRGPRSAGTVADVPFGLYAGGTFTSAGPTALNYIARWDGANWQPLGAGMNGTVRALEFWDARDGNGLMLYAAGDFTLAGGVPADRIAKWDGTQWHAVNSDVLNGLNNRVNTLAVWDAGDGKGESLVAGGTFTLAGGKSAGRLARLLGAPPSCPADLNHDSQVDDSDFVVFLFSYNILDCADPEIPAGCPSDLNHDGIVEDADFVIFLAAYNELLCP
ncbi:MAG: hypothetical protein U0573_02570 [Phycisphaerales bacterium]|nr:hypothetical protein [Planctomycetota bacterium]